MLLCLHCTFRKSINHTLPKYQIRVTFQKWAPAFFEPVLAPSVGKNWKMVNDKCIITMRVGISRKLCFIVKVFFMSITSFNSLLHLQYLEQRCDEWPHFKNKVSAAQRGSMVIQCHQVGGKGSRLKSSLLFPVSFPDAYSSKQFCFRREFISSQVLLGIGRSY